MTLHYGVEYIGKCVPPDLLARIDEVRCDPFSHSELDSLPLYNGQTGEKLLDMAGANPRRVSRRKMRNLLSQGLDVQYGKKATSVLLGPDETAIVTFSDGTKRSGSLIVGCEGAKSVVREALVGKEAAQVEDLDIQMFNIACSFPAEVALLVRKAHPMFKIGYHPEGLLWLQAIQDVQDPDKPETWLFQSCLMWVGAPRPDDFPDQASRLAFWKEKAKVYADPWRTTADHIPQDLQFGVDRTSFWKPSMDWTISELWPHVTLAGDAAHNMPPHRGQGLNTAFEDAAKLVEELTTASNGEKSLEQAIVEYEKDMKARTVREVDISVMQARMVHNWDQLMQAPMFKNGMHKYREEMAANDKPVELATDAHV